MRVIVIDNYDSFTYNLVHQLREIGVEYDVYRNDQIDLDEVEKYDKIIFSPGPGIPDEAGRMKEIIRRFLGEKSMFGVCLGHQAIAEVCGARLLLLDEVFHGVSTEINVEENSRLFEGLSARIEVGRYHSWVIDPSSLPESLSVTAHDDQDQIMAISHREFDVHGVQFHPESILTPTGLDMMKRFLGNTAPKPLMNTQNNSTTPARP